MNKPLISVIIPVYNVERYLVRCLDSLLAQTFDKFEAILVNDGSKDSSGTICDRYAASDSRIRVIHQPNAGTMAARHHGYSVAQGDYLLFCDSDDTMPTHAFETLYNAAIQQQTDIVFGGHTSVYDNGKHIVSQHRLPQECTRENMQRAMLSHDVFCTLWGNIYKRNLFTDHTYHIPPSLLHEDRLMQIQIIDNSRSFGVVSASVYDYYQNDTSITRNRMSDDKLRGSLDACEWQIEYMQSQGVCWKEAKIFYLKQMNWLLENGYAKHSIVNHSTTSRAIYRLKEVSSLASRAYTLHTLLLCHSWLYRQCCRAGRTLLRYYREH